jgi:peptidoglycan/LPS O-acetylase OafA/YrhL
MVFLQHYILLPWGNAGVNVFFVLSGFLITGILIDTRDDPHRARNFYIRRALRIFPLYYGIFAILLVTTPMMHWQWTGYWITWPLYLGNSLRFLASPSAYTHALHAAADGHLDMRQFRFANALGVGHFWSLCVEEQFYLFWPWVVFAIPSRRVLIWICSVVVVLLPFLRLFLQPHIPAWMLDREVFYRLTPFQLDSLLLGALLALLWRGSRRQQMLQFAQRVTSPTLLLCAASYFWTMHRGGFYSFPYPTWRWTFGLTLTNVVSALLLICALRPGTWAYRLLSLSWMRSIGRITYGAYIFHDMYSGWVRSVFDALFPGYAHAHRTVSTGAISIASLMLTIALAWLSFHFFESPFLNLKEKWTHSTLQPQVIGTTASPAGASSPNPASSI